MTDSPLEVTIIGGGASGVLLAIHLLRDLEADIRLTLVERRQAVGQGVAYSTVQADHILNVPASNMSALPDDPDHFWHWLKARVPEYTDPWVFAPRRLYGDYLGDTLRAAAAPEPGRLRIVHAECLELAETSTGIAARLDNGESVANDIAVLAVGHEEQPARGRGIAVRVGSERDTPLPAGAPVMILGSGLSMVDAWLRLDDVRHTGTIHVVSRHGLLPRSHRQAAKLVLDEAEVPLGADAPRLAHWLRGRAAGLMAEGGDWRSVVDALRPFNQRIWQGWSDESRRQFLEHLRPWWNIHRHRMPPETFARMKDAAERGQVRLVAGKFLGVERLPDGARATIRRRGRAETETLDVARVYDCGGITVDVEASTNPLVRSLVSRGLARPDAQHIGLDVTDDCRVIDSAGRASDRLFAVGPLTRGRFWEIEAVPDIRVQAAQVARRLLARH
ncbi:MAG TPA: FAD/NAD(P)-binding protein [Devosia sp.]|nr:FAD/NAD(P)-binding protein [Devosia sp.]